MKILYKRCWLFGTSTDFYAKATKDDDLIDHMSKPIFTNKGSVVGISQGLSRQINVGKILRLQGSECIKDFLDWIVVVEQFFDEIIISEEKMVKIATYRLIKGKSRFLVGLIAEDTD